MTESALFLALAGICYGMVRGAQYLNVKHDISCGSLMVLITIAGYFVGVPQPFHSLGIAMASVAAGYLIFMLFLRRPNGTKSTTP